MYYNVSLELFYILGLIGKLDSLLSKVNGCIENYEEEIIVNHQSLMLIICNLNDNYSI